MVEGFGVPIGVVLTPQDESYMKQHLLSTPEFPETGVAQIWFHPLEKEVVFSSSRFQRQDYDHVAVLSLVEVEGGYNVLALILMSEKHHREIIKEIGRTITSILRKYQ